VRGCAPKVGLAAIVGAFAAGLSLDEVYVRPYGKESKHDLAEMVKPMVAVLAPIFFVRTGMAVDFAQLDAGALLLAGALTVVAIAGKLAAGIAAGRGMDRLAVGIGMVPRGEVGLIFAGAGAASTVDGAPLLGGGTFAALVLMVAATTFVTPPWLALRLRAR
jgi:Kef-type K+ transport system membrane component KefB